MKFEFSLHGSNWYVYDPMKEKYICKVPDRIMYWFMPMIRKDDQKKVIYFNAHFHNVKADERG